MKVPCLPATPVREMQFIFSRTKVFHLAPSVDCAGQSRDGAGTPVTQEQVSQLEQHVEDIDYEAAARYEKELRHDVMAHIHAYGDQCALTPCLLSTWAPPAAMWATTRM